MSFSANFPKRVRIVEVGPRDGLQNESAPITLEARVRLVEDLLAAGLCDIEAGAFVSPRWVPQMAGSAEVFQRVKAPAAARLFALVPNERGVREAMEAGCRHVAIFTAASEGFARKNINATIDESFVRFQPIAAIARQENLSLRGYVSTCFFCPYDGKTAPEKVLPVVQRMLDELGVFEVSLGDTIGAATPTDVERLLEVLLAKIPAERLALHFHDTRGTALANVMVGLSYGIATYDASAGGLGGCPYAPAATGNLATEDLLYTLHGMGIETGVSLEGVAAASVTLRHALQKKLPSRVLATLHREERLA